ESICVRSWCVSRPAGVGSIVARASLDALQLVRTPVAGLWSEFRRSFLPSAESNREFVVIQGVDTEQFAIGVEPIDGFGVRFGVQLERSPGRCAHAAGFDGQIALLENELL